MIEKKNLILEEIDKIEKDLLELSKNIHSNPELGFQEYKAMNWITALLREHGFEIIVPIGGMETAFKAIYRGKESGPRVAFLAEYDALRGIGHGCGHNIIATSAAGAAIGLSKVMEELGGEVILLGTPAEEGGGGKIHLIENGVFDTVDYALMMHPSTKSMIGRGGLASTKVLVEFKGKATHSAGPQSGINALQALIAVFNGIDSLRGILEDQTRINGIITDGGVASNIIPDYAKAEFTVRAKTQGYLKYVIKKIEAIANAASLWTGAEAKVDSGLIYAERYPNMAIAETFKSNMKLLGEEMGYPDPDEIIGSSDIGNVSLRVPSIHSYLKIADKNVNSHSLEFVEASISERGNEIAIKAAKGLAMTGYDILTKKELREAIEKEFDVKVRNKQ